MGHFNIHITGVGGQGIGLLSEIILRAVDHAGLPVKSVDTHGLAQRGGAVVSQVRIGDGVFSPLIPGGRADLGVALERHEAMRMLAQAVKKRGTALYYDTVWQPRDVRLGYISEIAAADVVRESRRRDIRLITVPKKELSDFRMQNMVLLAALDRYGLIPGLSTGHYKKAMADLLEGDKLEQNMQLFLAPVSGAA